MSRLFRCALAAGAGLCLASAAAAQPPPAPPAAERDRVWAQTYSDLPADPAVRFGTLANGMRFAIMRNATPTGQVSLRLRIGSGSLEESDADQGLAHFLEHLSFDGSTHVPKGEVVKTLQRLGLAFGADTNAATGFTDTVFQFDLPESDPNTVGSGLMLMREIAGNLTLTADAMGPERGVVLSEERLRDTPDFEALKQRLDFDFKGQLIAHRLPIGLVKVIQDATPDQMRALYRANYRPDRATLVIVGDIDPAVAEAAIRARFSDWAPVGPETATPDYGQPLHRGAQAQLIVRQGVNPSMSIDWAAPYDPTPDTVARERRDLIERIGFMVLDRRFERLAHGEQPPFLQAGAYRQNFKRSAKAASLQIAFRPQAWRDALEAAVKTQRQVLQFGVRQDEVERELTEYRVQLRNAAAGAATRRTPEIANEIVRTVDDQDVDTSPAEDLALFDQLTKGLTAAEVDASLRQAFTGSGPLLSMTTPDSVEGGEAALSAAFAQARAAALVAPAAPSASAWSYTRFGPPGRVVEQSRVEDLGVTLVRFANGVRLTVKPTGFRRDQTLVAVRFNNGRLALPEREEPSLWALNGFVEAGLRNLTYEDLQQALASKTVSIELALGDSAFTFSGATRPQDLDTQLQLIAAYMTAPGWRPEAYQQARSEVGVALGALSSTPQGVQARDLAELEHSGDERWHVPTPVEVRTDAIAPFRALMQRALTSGPLEVEIVGDVSTSQAIAAVASTFAALPPRPADPVASGALSIRFPAPSPQPVQRTHLGRSDQAIGYIAWPTFDLFADPQRAREMNVTAEVLGSRLVDQVRIAEGATYSPVSRADASETFPGYGFAYASVETPPAKLASFYANVDRIAADIIAHGVTADELNRAKAPRIEQIEKAQQSNEYWLARLQGVQTDPRRLALIRDTLPGYRKVTAEDVRRTAAAYLTRGRSWRFEVEPVHPSSVSGQGAGAVAIPPAGPLVAPRSPPATPRPDARPPTTPGAAPTGPATPAASPSLKTPAAPTPATSPLGPGG